MLVSKKHKKLLLNLREPERVTSVIPSARTLEYKGRTLVAVPHRLDEVRVLRNLNLDPPTPLETYYDWPGRFPPFIHQRTTSGFLSSNPRAFCLNGLGSGKTISALWAFDYLRSQGLVRKMLVLCPMSTMERAWGDEIFRNFPHLNFAVLHGDREKRHKLLAEEFDIYIINHDGIKSADTCELLARREGLDLVVVDELAVYRNAATARWKAANTIINGDTKRGIPAKPWAWGMTGTPIPNGPVDAYAQVRLICPGRVPKYFGHFRDQVMKQITQYKYEARETALQTVHEVMQPAIRFAREDCIDLPPTTYMTRQAQLTPEQKKAFDEMLRRFKTEHAGGQITAVNAAVKMNKLLQICLGTAYGNDGDVVIPAQPRIDLVREIIEEAEAKVLVFVPLTGALEALAADLRKDYTVAVVHGATSRGQRDQIFKEFQQSPNPRVLVANPGTLSHGLTLTAANTIVWFGPTHSNETWEQANGRIARPGQKLNTLIVNVVATPLEQKIFDRLAGRQQVQGALLDLIRDDR